MIKLYETKISANVEKLSKEVEIAVHKSALICKLICGTNYTMTITSGNDGVHMKKSKHYENNAIDIRTRDMENWQKLIVQEKIAKELGRHYDVILEETHLHIEYDPK